MPAPALLVAFAAVLLVVHAQSSLNDAAVRVRLKPQTFSSCVPPGTNSIVFTGPTQKCPCTLYVAEGNQTAHKARVEYLVVRDTNGRKWNQTAAGSHVPATTLLSDGGSPLTRFSLNPGSSRKIRVDDTGPFRLLLHANAKRSACISVQYMFEPRGTKCPARLPVPKRRVSVPAPRVPRELSALKRKELVVNKVVLGSPVHDAALQRFMVSMRGPSGGACTGTVLSNRWILTAAHCAPSLETVLFVGGANFGAGPLYKTERVVVHPRYAAGTDGGGSVTSAVENDVALIRTQTVIHDVHAVAVNGNPKFPGANDIVRAVGYGLSDSRMDAASKTAAGLHQVDTAVVRFHDCRQAYTHAGRGRELPGLRQKVHLCAGPDAVCRGGVCRGDSGGPLLVRSGGGGFVQVAVTSFGLDCRFKEFAPDVFARVSTYAKWISEVTEGQAMILDAGATSAGTRQGGESATLAGQKEALRLRRILRRRTLGLGIGGGVALLIAVILVLGAAYWWQRRRKEEKYGGADQGV